ncbi:MAG: hypothetical protein OXE98_04890 [Hyphomicrobiales bacterium]|nr:hypothetical protein [Hyphomicrobiales bacterium]
MLDTADIDIDGLLKTKLEALKNKKLHENHFDDLRASKVDLVHHFKTGEVHCMIKNIFALLVNLELLFVINNGLAGGLTEAKRFIRIGYGPRRHRVACVALRLI